MNNIAIAAGHDRTAQTAADVLSAGGNAVDAAIAAFLVSWIAEPCMASGGGGAFAHIFSAKGEAYLFDFFCQTPAQKRPQKELDFFPIQVDFGDALETFYIGKGASAVPGSIAGIYAMHRHFGSIPMRTLVQPAIKAAQEGVRINAFQSHDIGLLRPIFEASKQADAFFVNSKLIQEGDWLKLPQLADFLDYMGREGENAFYKGEVATKIIRDHAEQGGLLTQADFDNYQVHIRKPLSYTYHGHSVLTNPLPSIGGSIMVLLLHFLQKNNQQPLPCSFAHLREVYTAMRQVAAIGTHPLQLGLALQKIIPNFALPTRPSSNRRGSTSHFSIVDRWGNAVALTTTIGEGSGYFAENTQIHLNNMLGELSLMPGGYHSWTPNIRLSSMMAPTIVLDSLGKPVVVTGSGGASRIPTALMMVLDYLLRHNTGLAKAVAYPRLHLEHGQFQVEHGFETIATHDGFEDTVNQWRSTSMFFGGAHTVFRQGETYQAAGDARREGVGMEI